MAFLSADTLGLFLFIAGFVIGLGAVTVIDIHGFLGRKSTYWTEATTRTHKVTKPLIWIGISLAILGGVIWYRDASLSGFALAHSLLALVLIANGCFLSFRVSPYLLQREREGRASELLPATWQAAIASGLILSDLAWWSSLILLVAQLTRG